MVAVAAISLVAGIAIGTSADAERDEDRPELSAPVPTSEAQRRTDSSPTTEGRRESTTTTAAEATPGSRENPFPLGAELRSDDGLVVIVDAVRFDAAEEIAAANMFNEPAPDGSAYALITVTVRNETDDALHTGFSLDIGLVGSANRMYDGSNAYCQAVVPNPLYDGGELFPGGSYQGNECRVVPLAEVEDGSLLVAITPMMSFSDPVFVALS